MDQNPSSPHPPASTNAPVPAQKRPIRVMVIDDSPTVRKIIETSLGRETCRVAEGTALVGWGEHIFPSYSKYRVSSYGDPAEALQMLLAPEVVLPPDLILLDLILPNIDGIQLLRRCKQTQQLEKIPVIVITRKVGVIDRLKAKLAGAVAFIPKPFTVEDLLATMREVEQTHLSQKTDLWAFE